MTTAADDDGFVERRITAQDGLSLYLRDYGQRGHGGTPVVCLAGLTRNSRDFHRLAIRLSARRRVLCPDYRGRGQSARDPDWRNYTPATYLNDLRHIMIACGVGRVVAVGTSLGGLLGTALAVAQPNSLAGLILNDVGPDPDLAALARIIDYVGRDRPQPDWPSAAKHLSELLPTLSIRGEEGWLRLARATYREGPDDQLHFDWDVNLVRPLKQPGAEIPDLWPVFRATRRFPMLAIRGALSHVLRPETFEHMAQEHPAMARCVVPACGHAPQLDEPEALEAIDEFFDRI